MSGSENVFNVSYNKTGHAIVENLLRISGEMPHWLLYSTIVYYSSVFLFGLSGNILMLLVMYNSNVKSTTDVFMTFLTVLNLVALLVVLPVQLIKDLNVRSFLLPEIGCKIHSYLVVVTFIYSEFERYPKIFKWQSRSFLEKRPVCVSMLLFIVSLLPSVRQALMSEVNAEGECRVRTYWSYNSTLITALIIVVVLFPPLIICFCYARIMLRLRRMVNPFGLDSNPARFGTQRIQSFRRTRLFVSSRVLAIVTGLFLICTIIPSITGSIITSNSGQQAKYVNIHSVILSRLYFVNFSVNPYISFVQNTNLRRRVKDVFRSF